MDGLMVLGGLALLIGGGELLVRGAVRTAERLGLSPLLIGLTLVGFGTSMPELVTSVQASIAGSPGIAVGNIVGSNIANILLILGVAALIAPISIERAALLRDGGIVLVTAAIFAAVALTMPLDRAVGGAFLAGLAGYLALAYWQETARAKAHTAAFEKFEAHEEILDGKAGDSATTANAARRGPGTLLPLAMVLGGLAVIVAGGHLLVAGAVGIAREAGLSETFIGVTLVAVGTSLPELVTSVIAALRRHGDVAIGNVLGSNIYNVLGIGGATGLIAPTAIPAEIMDVEVPVMLGASVLLLVFGRTGGRIGRIEGAILLAGYAAFVAASWPSPPPG